MIVARAQPATLLADHAAEGTKLRTLFFAYADLLVLKDQFDAALLAHLKEGTGYRDLLEDLATLVHVFHAHPEFLREGAPVTATELAAASKLVEQLTLDVGERDDPDGVAAALLDERRRAATLLLRAYSEVQAAVTFLRRHEGDATTMAPALYVPRSSSGSAKNPVLPTPAPAAPTGAPEEPSDRPFEAKK